MVPAFDQDSNTSGLLLFAKSNSTFETFQDKGDINGYYDHDAQSIFVFATKSMNQRIDRIELSTPEWPNIIQTIIHEFQHFVDAPLKSDIEETEEDHYTEQALLEFKHEFRGTFTSGQEPDNSVTAQYPIGFNKSNIRHRMAVYTLWKNTISWKDGGTIHLLDLILESSNHLDNATKSRLKQKIISFSESCENNSSNPINSIKIFKISRFIDKHWPKDRLTWGDPEYHGPIEQLKLLFNNLNAVETEVLKNLWWQKLFNERLDSSDKKKIETIINKP